MKTGIIFRKTLLLLCASLVCVTTGFSQTPDWIKYYDPINFLSIAQWSSVTANASIVGINRDPMQITMLGWLNKRPTLLVNSAYDATHAVDLPASIRIQSQMSVANPKGESYLQFWSNDITNPVQWQLGEIRGVNIGTGTGAPGGFYKGGLAFYNSGGPDIGTAQTSPIEVMRIVNNRVGIMNPNPSVALDVTGSTKISSLSGAGSRMVVADASGLLSTQAIPSGGSGWSLTGNTLLTGNEYLGTNNNYDLKIRTNNIERARLSKDGFLGIGFPWGSEPTLEPIGPLDVQVHPWYKQSRVTFATNNMNDISHSSANTSIRIYRPVNGPAQYAYPWWIENSLSPNQGDEDGALHFKSTTQLDLSAGNEDPEVNPSSQLKSIMTLQRNGKVGVGTTSPRGYLDVAMDPGWNETKLSMDILNHQPSLRFYKNTGGDHPECPNGRWSETYQWWMQLSDFEGGWGDLQILTSAPSCYPNDNVTPVMTFQNNGNIGIGTQFPSAKLEVNGLLKGTTFNFTGTGDFKIGSNTNFIPDCAALPPTMNTRLIVDGQLLAKEVKVKSSCWPDFVFDDSYKLMSLKELSNYVKDEKHLPGIPSQHEVTEQGVNVGEMQANLLKKVEELTLYIIELEKEVNMLKQNKDNLNEK